MISEKSIGAMGSFLMLMTVALGAFGAHVIEAKLAPRPFEVYEKAIFYQFIHSLAIIILSGLPIPIAAKKSIYITFLVGILLFSGSLLAYSLSFLMVENGWRFFAFITPFGGVSFLLGWGMLTYQFMKK